jgi:hypothetical protein
MAKTKIETVTDAKGNAVHVCVLCTRRTRMHRAHAAAYSSTARAPDWITESTTVKEPGHPATTTRLPLL